MELVIELAVCDAIGGGGDPAGLLLVLELSLPLTSAAADLIRPSQRATGSGGFG